MRASSFDSSSFASWLDSQPDLSPKWQPKYIRLCTRLPTTPTNKILTRTLVHEKFRSDRVGGDPVYVRERGTDSFRQLTPLDESSLSESFELHGRLAAWEL